MKKRYVFYLLFAAAAAVFPQESTNNGVIRTDHFEVSAGSAKDAELAAKQMEDRFAVYNRLFRFDPAQAPLPLKVRLFNNTESYNAYLASRLVPARAGAVYLHYPQSEKRELVINLDSEDQNRDLPYQAFTQFFRAFVPQPPAWMREGFAVFFSALRFDNGRLVYGENLAWLDTVKNMQNRPSVEDILTADGPQANPENFQALAWSLVSFLMNSGNEARMRALTDSFMTLSPSAPARENAGAVQKRIMLGTSAGELSREYQNYLNSRKTFAELVAEGQKCYAAGDRQNAELSFRSALRQNPDHFVPYYYLGLISYAENNYDAAERYYRAADEQHGGGGQAQIRYARGLNALAAGKNTEAADYLRQAAQTAPERYQAKVEKIIALLTATKE
jgi:tetratricopeptide (TPR) repeat protein